VDPAADPAARPLTSPPPTGERTRPPLRVAVLLGLLVAVAFVIRIDALRNSAPPVPELGDARAYHLLGANLADGRGYIRPYEALDGVEIATAEYPPGLPLVLAGATLVGVEGTEGQRVLLCAVGALTVGLVGLVGRRLGGDGVGYGAAAVAAVHPALWNSDTTLMAEPLAAFAGAALVLGALGVADAPSRRNWALLGAAGGLACLVRSEFLLMAPMLMAVVAWHTAADEGSAPARARLRPAAAQVGIGLLGLLVLLAPWTARNLATFGSFVPLSNNSGSVARGANCDAAYRGEFRGLWVTDVALDGLDADERRAGCFSGFGIRPGEDEADAAARLRADGTAYARDHLDELPAVVAARLGRTLGLYRFEQQSNFAFAEGRNATWERRGTRGFQLMAVVGLAGLVAGAVRRDLPWRRWLLVVPVVAVLIVVAATYGNPRFRAAAEPAVVVLAVLAVGDAVAALRSRRAASS
jgi:4-amino-4-deoxy-L-arabinose transferase-like glycosyltransferase